VKDSVPRQDIVDSVKGGQRRSTQEQGAGHNHAVDLAHDFGGAILFSFPLLMTMEMWWLGFYMDRLQLALFLTLAFIMILGLSYFEGGEETFAIEVMDALVACATGYTVAAGMLLLFGIIKPGMSADEIVGKISLHAIPCSIGAILARRQLNVEETHKEQRRKQGYGAKLFLMGVGSIFLAFQLAPTEEMVLIGHMMNGWQAAALSVVSLCVMQAFLCSVEKGRRKSIFSAGFFRDVFLRFTIVGYALALLISLYILWTFDRLDGMALQEIILATLVLGFPASLGASAARLIL
jgi:putative integral membrane protein (TIGR02587 family)